MSVGVVGEIAHQIQFAVEENQSRFGIGLAQDRLQHRRQTAHPIKLTPCSAPTLDRDHQRDRLGLGRFVQIGHLFDAIVFDDEILGLQSVHHVAVCISHQRGHQHHVGLGIEGGLLRRGGRSKHQHEHDNAANWL